MSGELTCCANAVLDRELALVCLVLQALVVAQVLHLPPNQTQIHNNTACTLLSQLGC